MKRLLLMCVLAMCVLSAVQASETLNLEKLTREELLALKDAIVQELSNNHEASSKEQDKVLEVTKIATESHFSRLGIDISWAWFNYEYTKDWNLYTIKTHIDFKDKAGNKQKPDVYGEVYNSGGTYQLIYLTVGDESVLDHRASLPKDLRSSMDTTKLALASTSQKSPPVVVTPQPTIKVSAAELIKAYDNNELKADAAYKGKLLEVKGKVAGVRSSWGSTIVEVGTGQQFEWGISCYMSKDQVTAAGRLNKGDSVTIIGIGDGLSFVSVTMKDCKVK